jgi:C4-type Zn-finger protein
VVEATGTNLSSTSRLLRRDSKVCPVCSHSSAHHECLGEIPFAGHASH